MGPQNITKRLGCRVATSTGATVQPEQLIFLIFQPCWHSPQQQSCGSMASATQLQFSTFACVNYEVVLGLETSMVLKASRDRAQHVCDPSSFQFRICTFIRTCTSCKDWDFTQFTLKHCHLFKPKQLFAPASGCAFAPNSRNPPRLHAKPGQPIPIHSKTHGIKLLTIWRREEKTREKKRREEKRRGEKEKESEERRYRCAKFWESHETLCVFPMICGSGGSKSRLAKAAGVEPSGEMRHEKLHVVIARKALRSQNAQSTPASDRSWKFGF